MTNSTNISHETLPQITMYLHSLENLPPLSLPPRFEAHSMRSDSPEIWNWIISAAFERTFDFETMMRTDSSYRDDRVWFIKEYSQTVATASAFYRPEYGEDCGYIHMVGTHPWAAGSGTGYLATLAALWQLKKEGFVKAVLTTDDYRLPAIATYLKLGFVPDLNAHESIPSRWENIQTQLALHKKTNVTKSIQLWEGDVPGFQSEYNQPGPTVMPYVVENSRGAVVVCPGGGYMMKANHEGYQIANMLNAAGISAFVLDYRVNPYHHPIPLTDAQRAIRLVRSFGYEKVGILGFSAGGHLAASAGTIYDAGNLNGDAIDKLSCRPDAVVPCYAVISLCAYRHQGSLSNLLGENPSYQLLRSLSAEQNITVDTPPMFLWHTANDGAVPVENSLMLASSLAKQGIPFELHIYPDGPHGLGLAGGNPIVGSWSGLVQKWFNKQGFGIE